MHIPLISTFEKLMYRSLGHRTTNACINDPKAESCIRAAGYSTKLEEGLSLNDSNTGSRIPRGCRRCKKDNRFIILIHYKTGRTNSKIRSEMTKCFYPRLRRIESYVECPDCRRRSYNTGDYEHLSMPPIEF